MNDLEALREARRRFGAKGAVVKDPVYKDRQPTAEFKCYVGTREYLFGFASIFLEGQGPTWEEAFRAADAAALNRKLKPTPRPVMKLMTNPSPVVGESVKVMGHTYRKENTMATNLYSAKETKPGTWSAVETSNGRVVASFDTRKGLAEAYANRLNRAQKPAGYVPAAKVPKAPKPAVSAS